MSYCQECEIVYNDNCRRCPLCESAKQVEELEQEIDILTDDIADLQKEIDSFHNGPQD